MEDLAPKRWAFPPKNHNANIKTWRRFDDVLDFISTQKGQDN